MWDLLVHFCITDHPGEMPSLMVFRYQMKVQVSPNNRRKREGTRRAGRQARATPASVPGLAQTGRRGRCRDTRPKPRSRASGSLWATEGLRPQNPRLVTLTPNPRQPEADFRQPRTQGRRILGGKSGRSTRGSTTWRKQPGGRWGPSAPGVPARPSYSPR